MEVYEDRRVGAAYGCHHGSGGGTGSPTSEFCGDVPSTPEAVRKLVGRLDDGKMDLRFCYEAGPCGYGLYRQLTMMGYDCSVVAPSLSPRRPGVAHQDRSGVTR